MSFVERDEKLWQSVSSIAEDEGLLLYDLSRAGDGALSVYVDKQPDSSEKLGESGERITSGDCTRLCKRLRAYFLVEGGSLGVGEDPAIEVSSPGINRFLRLDTHFENACGQRVRLVLEEEEGISSPLIGELCEVSDGQLLVVSESSGSEVRVGQASVKRARVDFQF